MPLPIIELNKPIVNPKKYAERLRDISYWRASERVDQTYFSTRAPDGLPVIIPLSCEQDDDYRERLGLTRRTNFVRQFVRRYNQAVYRHQPQRTPTPVVERLLEDADGEGTPLDTLMKNALWEAQVAGSACVITESSTSTSEGLTAAQAEDLGEQFHLRLVKAENILDVGREENTTTWVLLLFYDDQGPWARLYTDFDTQDFRLDEKTLMVRSMMDPTPHGLDTLPVSVIEPEVDTSQVASWADIQRTIHNTDSFLRLELTNHTFTRWILTGIRGGNDDDDDNPQAHRRKPSIQWGSRRIWTFEDENVGVNRLGADISQAESLRKTIDEDTQTLYRVAGLQATFRVDGAPQSGVSRLVELEDFSIAADQLADLMESAENHLLGVIAATEGQEVSETVYSRDFSESSFEASAERLQKMADLVDSAYEEEDAREIKRQLVSRVLKQNFDVDLSGTAAGE